MISATDKLEDLSDLDVPAHEGQMHKHACTEIWKGR